MKKLFSYLFPVMMTLAAFTLFSCSDDDSAEPGTEPTPPAVDEGVVEISSDGEQKDVVIPVDEPWEATSSADWLQLSQMGGKGGESVKVIAAKNITGRERTGYIRFAEAALTRASVDSMQIVVRQPANEGEVAPGVVLTSAYYENGGIYVEIYNGRESTSSTQQLASASPSFTFTDPNATVPTKEPIVYVKQGETYKANPYIVLNTDGVAEGKFSIGGEQSVNTLRVSQNVVFADMGELDNSDSAGIHFTDGNLIYYGGGIIEHTSLGYEQTVPCYEFRSYNPETGEERAYADIPEGTAGACWQGVPIVVGSEGIYSLDGGAWRTIAVRTGTAVAAAVEGNTLYVVTGSATETYALGQDADGNLTATLDDSKEHGLYFGNVTVTHDDDGTTWLMDDLYCNAYAVKQGVLEATECTPADSLNPQIDFIGVAGGYIYAFDGTSIIRYAVGNGTPEQLRMLGTFEWYGAAECVGGRLYSFGGTTQFRGTETASAALRRFSPADYAPISVAILPY